MKDFFNKYLDPRAILREKRVYKEQTRRVEALPDPYRYAFRRIQRYLWSCGPGDGVDMAQLQSDLLELFEENAARGTPLLEVTGRDVAGFVDELLRSARRYGFDARQRLNEDVLRRAEQ